MQVSDRIYVAGGDKLIGKAVLRALGAGGYTDVVGGVGVDPDWADSGATRAFFAQHAPRFVISAAGKSGGIDFNKKHPATLLRDNLLVASNLMHAAYEAGVEKLLYVASSCAYPRACPQPMQEDSLFSGKPEPTNAAYSVGRLAGIAACKAYNTEYGVRFVPGIPADIYGPGDHFDPKNCHVVPALIRRMHEAKENGVDEIAIWGSGTPRREFFYADDLAAACLFVMKHYEGAEPINLGGGADTAISELALQIKEVVGYDGELVFDTSKPDGMPRKRLDSTKLLDLGWKPNTSLRQGLEATYGWFLGNVVGAVEHSATL